MSEQHLAHFAVYALFALHELYGNIAEGESHHLRTEFIGRSEGHQRRLQLRHCMSQSLRKGVAVPCGARCRVGLAAAGNENCR